MAALPWLAALPAHPPAGVCPPSCPNNELQWLFDRYCSDKGTFWQSKHHYGSAYHALFASVRGSVRALLEIGIGEDTAPSVAAWADYFPHARIYSFDVKDPKEFAQRAAHGGATERLAKRQAKFGCEYNASMWRDPRLVLTLGLDATDAEHLEVRPSSPASSRLQSCARLCNRTHRLQPRADAQTRARLRRRRWQHALPAEPLDVIIDDGSHKFLDQQATLHTLWPHLRPGGFYVVEGAARRLERHGGLDDARAPETDPAPPSQTWQTVWSAPCRGTRPSRRKCRRSTPAAGTSASSEKARGEPVAFQPLGR
jgi:hypothetical protein